MGKDKESPNIQARKELLNLVISNRHAWNLETVVMADLHRKKAVADGTDTGQEARH